MPLARSRRPAGRRILTLAIIPAMLISIVPALADDPPRDFARWEPAIAQFDWKDRESPPPKGGTLFVGSSSIRAWNLAESFPGRKTINRGFGGSEIADSTHFADRLIVPHEPRTVILYAGDNDLARGRSAEQVAADFRAFAATVHERLPKAKVVFIGIKPSIARWKLWDQAQRANALIREECGRQEWLEFVDVAPAMLGEDGRPRPELFVNDGLHLSRQGYEVWAKLVAPHVE